MPLKDPIARAAYQKTYAQKNRDATNKRNREWKKANPERAAEVSRKTRLKNKARVLANKAKYRASKRNKTPIWVDKEHLWLIKQAYELAILRTKQFGFIWHVDHIIPLNGVNVSGLHVIENIQVIPAAENLLKNNKYEIDYAN